jgi:hypothetical protein
MLYWLFVLPWVPLSALFNLRWQGPPLYQPLGCVWTLYPNVNTVIRGTNFDMATWLFKLLLNFESIIEKG